MHTAATKNIDVIAFKTEKVNACIDLNSIDKMCLLPALQKVPETENYLAGLMILGGKTIPVIDLSLRLGIERKNKYSLETPVLICHNTTHQQVGIIVDKILGLHSIEPSKLEIKSETNKKETLFTATVNIEGQLTLLLDINQLQVNRI